MKNNKAPEGAKNSSFDKMIIDESKPLVKPTSKIELCLIAFLNAGLKGLHTFDVHVRSEAQARSLEGTGLYWTNCLSSDVSKLKRLHSIDIHDQFEPYFSQHGHTTRFKRYWIPDRAQASVALEAINHLRVIRGAEKLTEAERAALLVEYPLSN